MAADDRQILADIREQPKVEGGDRREMQRLAGDRLHRRRASPIGADPGPESVVRPARLRLHLLARLAAGLADRGAVEIIELRQAGAVPPGYESTMLDPLGRTFMLSLRKQFLPRSFYQQQLQKFQKQQAPQP
jgi:hypothetical protein